MDFRNKKIMINLAIAVIAGALVPLAYAPFNLYLLSIAALAMVFYLWKESGSAKQSFIIGYLFGLAMFGVGVNWLYISINLFGGVNIIGALFFTYCLVAFIALFPALCGYLATRFYQDRLLMALPPLWLITEWSRSWLLTGFPWLNIGTSQTDSPLSAYGPVLGDYGISFIVCVLSALIVGMMTGVRKTRLTSAVVFILLCTVTWPLGNTNWVQETQDNLKVALIQGAIPQEIKWKPELRQKTYDIYTGLSEPYWSADLIIWPETAIPSSYHLANDFLDNIRERMRDENALFMSGIPYQHELTKRYFNSILMIDDQDHFYHKHRLVPFGEYLPLKSLLDKVLHFLKIPMSDFTPGDPTQKLFITDKGIFGMSVCYEDAYGTEIRRSLPEANVLINVSNDAWFGDSLAPHQHLQIARMRAIESGRYLLRATNTGISAVIDQDGDIVTQSPQFKPHALVAEVALFEGSTPFIRYGNLPILVLTGILLVCLSALRKRYAKSSS